MAHVFSYLFGVGICWCLYALAWPWLGPILFDHPPLFTPHGALIAAAFQALCDMIGMWVRDTRYVKRDGT